MEKKKYRVWEYEWMVWKKAILDTVGFYQTNKLAAFGNVIGSLLTLFYVYMQGGVKAMNDQILVLAATLFGFIGTAFFYVLVHRMSAPVVLYREKQREANLFTFKDIEIEPYHFPEGSGYGVGLKLISYKSKNRPISNVVIGIREIIEGNEKKNQNTIQLPILTGSGSIFQRSVGIVNQVDRFELAELSAIPIASWNNEQAWILSNDGQGKSVEMKKNVTYRVIIGIDARLMLPPIIDQKLEGCGLWCDLIWKDNNGVVLRIHKRNPPYE